MIQLYPTTTPDGALAAEELVDLQHQISLLQLKSAACAARLAKSDYWDYAGSNSAIDWIRFNCHLTDKPPPTWSPSVGPPARCRRACRPWRLETSATATWS